MIRIYGKKNKNIMIYRNILICLLILVCSCHRNKPILNKINVDNNCNLFVSTTKGIYKYEQRINRWHKMNNENIVDLEISDNNTIYFSSTNGLFYSDDYGRSWKKVSFELKDWLESAEIDIDLVDNNNLLIATYHGLYTFDKIKQNSSKLYDSQTLILSPIALNQDTIFAFELNSGLICSYNKGKEWKLVGKNIFNKSMVRDIVYNKNNIFVTTVNNFLFKSSNHGESWTQLRNGLRDSVIVTIAIGQDNRIFVANDLTIFYSDNSGLNWLEISTNIIEIITSIALDKNGIIYATTYSNGIFYSKDNGDHWEKFCNADIFK